MATPSRPPDTSDLFAQLLVELQEGSEPDIDRLCGKSEATRRGLRAAWLDWRRGLAALGGRKLSPKADAFLARELGNLDTSEVPDSPSDSAWSEVLEGLAKHSPGPGRYRLRGEIARGGMGAILKVWDDDLKRSLAKKVLINRGHTPTAADDKSLGRFLEEAQVTAQLEHPGIIPVHDLGVDPDEGLYFTMRLVRGHDLRKVFEQVRLGEEGWNMTRALGVLLKVCEAMAYAHSRKIVHRDLKPANIMVGRFGEVYVMDWGLARLLSKDGSQYEVPNPQSPSDLTELTTLRSQLEEEHEQSPLFTQDGSIVGTLAFMSTEQARGEQAAIGPRSDVYSVGAILYQLLTGRMPYSGEKPVLSPTGMLQRLLAGPPRPVHELAPDTPGELIAICEKAMQRDPGNRFGDMSEFGDELRAYLEHRVVKSYRTGAAPEFFKWVHRNKSTAAATAALALAILGGVVGVAWQQHRLVSQARRSRDFLQAPALIAETSTLGSEEALGVAGLEHWITTVEDLLSRMPDYQAEYERGLALHEPTAKGAEAEPQVPEQQQIELGLVESTANSLELELTNARLGVAEGKPMTAKRMASALAVLPGEIEHGRRQAEHLSARTLHRALFTDPDTQRAQDEVRKLVRDLTNLAVPGTGGLDRMRERLRDLQELPLALEHPGWPLALASIADVDECPAYGGLEFEPQEGLVPLWRDPQSGLWEFLHVLSGEAPAYGEQGRGTVGSETGIVLVLMPGGTFTFGAQQMGTDLPNYDPLAEDPELFLTEVTLAPYFLSKYELTIAQWRRVRPVDRVFKAPGIRLNQTDRVTSSYPQDSVSFDEFREALAVWGLTFPTEAQHEFAARAGTTLPYGSNISFFGVQLRMNAAEVVDEDQRVHYFDGYIYAAPVDAYEPNAYGLYNILGNVKEWCLEWYGTGLLEELQFAPGSGELPLTNAVFRTSRGGSYGDSPGALYCRVSSRQGMNPAGNEYTGVRPARALDR